MGMSIKQGDTLNVTGVRTDDAGNPVDISGYSIASQLISGAYTHTLDCAVDDGAAGTFTMSASASETQSWPAKLYKFDIQFTRPGGEVSSTVTSNFIVTADNTRVV